MSVDGGRAQTREENGKTGVHSPAWKETKVACLQVMDSKEVQEDPHPMLPKAFLDKKVVRNLVDGLKGKKKESAKDTAENKKEKQYIEETRKKSEHIPKILKRFAFATLADSDTFGNQILHKVHQKNFHMAKRKAFIGDGDQKIWTIYADYFKYEKFVPILDFVHAIEYAFSAASISTETESQCWARYVDYATHIWQGKTLRVYRRIDKIVKELSASNKKASKTVQIKIEELTSISNYFKNNITRTNYTEYRKKGLPVSSCHVESLIKQFNRRVKSTEKFWYNSSLKGALVYKSMVISDDDSLQQFWKNRYELQQISKRPYKKVPA